MKPKSDETDRPMRRVMKQTGVMHAGALIAALTSWPISARAQDTPDEQSVVISASVSLDYSSRAAFERAAAVAGTRSITVTSGDTLRGIVAREFQVGAGSPVARALLQEKIVALNAGIVAHPDGLRAGTVVSVPDLPQIARADNPLWAEANAPKIAFSASLMASLPAVRQRTSNALSITAPGRPHAQEAVIFRRVSRQEAQQLVEKVPDLQVRSAPLPISFEDGGATSTDASAASHSTIRKDAAIVQRAFMQPPQQKPVLIVLDDSWPDDSSFQASRDFVVDGIAKIREHYQVRDSGSIPGTVRSSAKTRWIQSSTPPERHSEKVRDALAPLVALEPQGDPRVRVTYLPLVARQYGSKEVLTELIALNQIISLAHDDNTHPILDDMVSRGRKLAEDIVEDLPQSFDKSFTDVAVVEAVWSFCRYYNTAMKQPCFVSMSWTTPDQYFQARVPDVMYGALVAAAGNHGCPPNASPGCVLGSLYDSGAQFAARSMAPGDVLAVVNIDDSGNPTCRSTGLGAVYLDQFVVAYDGYVDDATCGTSFSTPRVAWLLAAREAYRKFPENQRLWRAALAQEVRKSRGSQAGQYGEIRFRAEKFFSND